MHSRTRPSAPKPTLATMLAVLLLASSVQAQTTAPTAQARSTENVLNIYSARHYQTDELLYNNFTAQTGIKINRVDSDDAGILARLGSEGTRSPADVILLVDAARLWRAEVNDLFQPVASTALSTRIPQALRGKDDGQGSRWFGLSVRARVLVYDKSKVQAKDVATYEMLAEPVNKGRVCSRSGAHPYNLSLFGSLVEIWGASATEQWLAGVVSNMARAPKGGDTDQIRAVASGECAVAITNSYYLARLMRSTKAEDRATMERVGVMLPNQQSSGVHVNIAGGAVAKHAPHRAAAVRFLEYLASDEAQKYFADGNNEWPAVRGLKIQNTALDSMSGYKAQTVSVAVMGMNQVKVQQMLDRVGYR